MITVNKKFILIPLLALGLIFAPQDEALAVSCSDCVIAPSHKVDKGVASPGEVLTYTIKVESVGAGTVDPVFVAETFSPYVDYIPGTTWAYKAGMSVHVTDAWLTDGLNLGALPSGQVVTVEFQVRIKGDAPDGAFVESVAQIKKTWLGDEVNEWIQCAAQTTVKGEVLGEEDVPKVLAVTGPEDVLATGLLLGYLGFLVRKLKLTKYL